MEGCTGWFAAPLVHSTQLYYRIVDLSSQIATNVNTCAQAALLRLFALITLLYILVLSPLLRWQTPGSLADASGLFQQGDRILTCNGKDLRTANQQDAVSFLKV